MDFNCIYNKYYSDIPRFVKNIIFNFQNNPENKLAKIL